MLVVDDRSGAVCTVSTAVEETLARGDRTRADMLGRLISMLRENGHISAIELEELLMWRYTEVNGG